MYEDATHLQDTFYRLKIPEFKELQISSLYQKKFIILMIEFIVTLQIFVHYIMILIIYKISFL